MFTIRQFGQEAEFNVMSAIDCYQHEMIGRVRCPMRHPLYGRKDGRLFDWLPVYRLLETVDHADSITGRAGDIVIGGGSGEAPSTTFAMPNTFSYYTADWPDDPESPPLPYATFWSPNTIYTFGVGFETIGWQPDCVALFDWLAQHLMAFLIEREPHRYGSLVGTDPITEDGIIFYNEQ